MAPWDSRPPTSLRLRVDARATFRVVHDGQVAVEVRHGKAVDHRERHPGRACEPGRGLPGPDLSQRLLAHGAGARPGRAVLAAPRIPDPLSRGGGEDGDRIPRRGEDLR